ncbi:hypothetical protein D9611_003252 [Ephemerocybe angulata]|uniref:RBR-type E3 ubiquitin transferase n=1 Tax=Ephemerocybe angulata TaxID=980116 RepID=A0A8H5FHX5_9AGAR|nr:hypothetical protein D9611_003252 [Tulosesus angulatus]
MPIPTTTHPSQEVLDECQILQKEEFEVLEASRGPIPFRTLSYSYVVQSIYPEYVSSHLNEGNLKLEVPVELEHPQDVTIARDVPSDSSAFPMSETVSVSTLPALLIHISLPSTYPLEESPRISSIRATHLWLPRIGKLNKLLTDMWQAGDGVLYMWLEYLRTGEFLKALELVDGSDSKILITHPNPPSLAPLLLSSDQRSQSSQFAKNTYPCSVCLATLKGSKCLQLSCKHIFCRGCLQDFWGMCIEEGDVGRVGCPDPDCVKRKREANEEEVARVVSGEEVDRWRWLREKRNLEKDPTIVHCPVDNCQSPVKKPANEDPESGRTWHGPISPCVIAHSEKVVLEYLASDEGSVERERIEQQYGKGNIAKLVNRYNEEIANNEWMKNSTTECPGCSCRVEKSLGCNHMTCWKCGKHFCYRCGAAISAADPYAHFSQPGRCYQKLFDFEAQDLEWQDMGEFVDV